MTMMMIHCPSCGAQLNVPEGAAGRLGRCPACEGQIRIPAEEQVLEESVTSWLAEGAEADEDDEGEAHPPPAGRVSSPASPAARDPSAAPRPARPGDRAESASREHEPSPAAPSRPEGEPAPNVAPPGRQAPDAEPPPPSGSPPRAAAAEPRTSSPATPKQQPGQPQSRPRSASTGKPVYQVRSAVKPLQPREDDLVTYKASDQPRTAAVPRPAPQRPRPVPEADPTDDRNVFLAVLEVAPSGVRLAFDARLLDRLAFRASMPFHCMSCGQKESEQLIARPLSWISRGTGKSADPFDIENTYEAEVRAHQLAREVVQSMGSINQYNAPLNQPMPYYVCRACQKRARCTGESVASPGGVHCEVRVPSGYYALEWLGRVNGVCGDDYLELESEVLKAEDGTWRELPEQVRHRLTAWFDFRAGERFLAYYCDSDFGKKEAGLGGVVLTDQRLVYCKYHHQGSIPLQEGGELRAVEDGPFRKIVHRHEGHARKLVHLRPDDWGSLRGALNGLGMPLRAPGEGR